MIKFSAFKSVNFMKCRFMFNSFKKADMVLFKNNSIGFIHVIYQLKYGNAIGCCIVNLRCICCVFAVGHCEPLARGEVLFVKVVYQKLFTISSVLFELYFYFYYKSLRVINSLHLLIFLQKNKLQ